MALGGGSSDPAPASVESSPTGSNPDAPKITELPSASPRGSPNGFLPFPPPESNDCLAMANRDEGVSGQDDMTAKNSTIAFSVILAPDGNPSTLESRLDNSMQSIFVPWL